MGDIVVMLSHEEDKGVLLELKGRGCRQFETFYSPKSVAGMTFRRLSKSRWRDETLRPGNQ